MEKSVSRREHKIFAGLLRELREKAGLTQAELAERVGETQSYISKWERGELRLDLVQLRELCGAMGVGLSEFVAEFESRVLAKRR